MAERGRPGGRSAIIDNPPLASEPLYWNSTAMRAAELPAANAIGTARSIARLYGWLSDGGEVDSVRILSEETLRKGRVPLFEQLDAISGRPSASGVGFMLQTSERLL